MKRIFLLVALATSLFASSACGKKDDTTPVQSSKDSLEQKFIGKWKMFEADVDNNGKEVGEPITDKCQYIEYLAGGKGNIITYDHTNCESAPDDSKKDMNPFRWKLEKGYLLSMVYPQNNKSGKFKIISATDIRIDFENENSEDIKDKENVIKKRYYLIRMK
jgi:lipoprotein